MLWTPGTPIQINSNTEFVTMKATDANLLNFINSAPQFVIPIYQRTYFWTERECRQLWEDSRIGKPATDEDDGFTAMEWIEAVVAGLDGAAAGRQMSIPANGSHPQTPESNTRVRKRA